MSAGPADRPPFELVAGDDTAVCVDGVCAVPVTEEDPRPVSPR